jgi:ATP-dependent DNA ligase
MKTTLHTLYKQTNTGKIQQWTVSVDGNRVITEFGQVEGKLQTTEDVIKLGKNLGRSNATTPETQALAQAKQGWEAKVKEGYVEDIETATNKKNNLEAVEPMLAYPIDKKEKHVTFPAFAQPKLDGVRCIAIIKNGKARLFSRTQKEFLTMPHIVNELERWFKDDIILDGELYRHSFSKDFNKITSIINRDEVHPEHTSIQYHIYDVVGSGNYLTRTANMKTIIGQAKIIKEAWYLEVVKTKVINSREELEEYQSECVGRNYEGCMYRSQEGIYEHKRSNNLLKVKTFMDAEYPIFDLEEGTGKLIGKVGAFLLSMPDGKTFKAKPMGSLELSEEYWKNKKQLIGKFATVKFQQLTPDGIPRFPVLKCIRNYE